MFQAYSKRSFTAAITSLKGNAYTPLNKLIINGQHVDAKSGKTFDLLNPSTGKLITRVAAAG